MNLKTVAVVLGTLLGTLAGVGSARADDPISVTSLLKQGFEVVGVMPSPAGPGLFMRKADKLIACFVSETPTSTTISTRYCKPVE